MIYNIWIEDVHGDNYGDDFGSQVPPNEASTPWEMFKKVVAWCEEKNVMPTVIDVTADESSPIETGEDHG